MSDAARGTKRKFDFDTSAVETLTREAEEAALRQIEREQAEGLGAPGHPEAIAFSLCWMTERVFYQRLVQDQPPSRDELVGALCDIWVRSVYGR